MRRNLYLVFGIAALWIGFACNREVAEHAEPPRGSQVSVPEQANTGSAAKPVYLDWLKPSPEPLPHGAWSAISTSILNAYLKAAGDSYTAVKETGLVLGDDGNFRFATVPAGWSRWSDRAIALFEAKKMAAILSVRTMSGDYGKIWRDATNPESRRLELLYVTFPDDRSRDGNIRAFSRQDREEVKGTLHVSEERYFNYGMPDKWAVVTLEVSDSGIEMTVEDMSLAFASCYPLVDGVSLQISSMK